MTSPVCVFHSRDGVNHCPDGFGAAVAFKMAYPDGEIVPAAYRSEPPVEAVRGRDAWVIDVTWQAEGTRALAEAATSLVVIDHHKTAEEHLEGFSHENARVVIDRSKSGAVLAWEEFFPREDIPLLFEHLQDFDLWKFDLEDTDAVDMALQLRGFDVDQWAAFACDDGKVERHLVQEGNVALKLMSRQVEAMLPLAHPQTIDGYRVPVVNAPRHLTDRLAARLAEGQPFAATYVEDGHCRHYSLRASATSKVDLTVVAGAYGGGGHPKAAGFSVRKPQGW